MRPYSLPSLLLALSTSLFLSSCDQAPGPDTNGEVHPPHYISRAICDLQATEGNSVRGMVTFSQVKGGVRIQADVFNLTEGEHGFHIHQYGDITSPDGSACEGHFNPHGHEHGGPSSDQRHLGDLGNLEADTSGYAHYDRIDRMISLNGPESIVGRSIIVHEKPDDLESQPTGAAGPRAAQGVIGIAK